MNFALYIPEYISFIFIKILKPTDSIQFDKRVNKLINSRFNAHNPAAILQLVSRIGIPLRINYTDRQSYIRNHIRWCRKLSSSYREHDNVTFTPSKYSVTLTTLNTLIPKYDYWRTSIHAIEISVRRSLSLIVPRSRMYAMSKSSQPLWLMVRNRSCCNTVRITSRIIALFHNVADNLFLVTSF